MRERIGRIDPLWVWVFGWMIAGLAIRLVFTARSPLPSEPGYLVNFDPIYYHRQAVAITDGHWFIRPGDAPGTPGADHPPLLTILLAAITFLGFGTWGEHRAFTALLGALVIPACAALAAKALGRRAGYVAAVLAAVNPMLWSNDGQLMPEPLFAMGVTLALLAGYQYLDRPTWRRLSVAGVLIGLATLARGEGVFLVPFLIVPLALTRRIGWQRRLGHAAAAATAALVVVLPWSVYNLTRLADPVPVSLSSDSALAGANCDQAYDGPAVAGWAIECLDVEVPPGSDASVVSKAHRRKALSYVRHHLSDLPRVAALRAGTIWGLRPGEYQKQELVQNRERPISAAALVAVAVTVAFSAFGIARRGRTVVWPLVSMVVMVTVIAAAFYANARFRVAGDVALTVLASGGVVRLVELVGRRRGGRPAEAEHCDTVAPVLPTRAAVGQP